jgi:DNA primase
MLETYADYAAGRLDLVRSAPNAFRALKRAMLAAARAAGVPTRMGGPRPWEARVQPRRPGRAERRAIVGALLDFPVLLDDSEMGDAIQLLEGESARIVAAIAKSMRVGSRGQASQASQAGQAGQVGQKVLDSTEFLAQMPPVIQAFASARLAAPEHDTVEEALQTVVANEKKLRESNIARETSEIVRQQQRVVGDWDTELALARQADTIVRERQGLMGTRVAGAVARTRVGQKHRGSDGDEES